MRKKSIPFPQANNVDVILSLLNSIDLERGITPIEVQQFHKLTPREGAYYLDALLFLSLLEAHGNRYFINDRCKAIRTSQNPKIALAQYIIMYHPFDVLNMQIQDNDSKKEKLDTISTYLFDNYQLSIATAKRRASCALSWIEWAEENK